MVQTKVNIAQAIGVPGEFYDDSPRRVAPYILRKNGDNIPAVALVFTAGTADNEAVLGGTGAFRGICVGPKQYANYMNLEPTMTLPDGTIGQLATMGHILVTVANAVTPDNVAIYNTTTGAISGMAAGRTVPEGSAAIPNSKFIFRSAAAGETAILELTD